MKAFFDSIARAFEMVGVHPVLGALIVGAVIAFIFTRRGSRDADDVAASHAAPLPASASFNTTVAHTDNMTMTVGERTVELPAGILAQIRAGNKVAAIKELRAATGVDLTTAKQLVDQIAASPVAK